jgi:hypothetical protein
MGRLEILKWPLKEQGVNGHGFMWLRQASVNNDQWSLNFLIDEELFYKLCDSLLFKTSITQL